MKLEKKQATSTADKGQHRRMKVQTGIGGVYATASIPPRIAAPLQRPVENAWRTSDIRMQMGQDDENNREKQTTHEEIDDTYGVDDGAYSPYLEGMGVPAPTIGDKMSSVSFPESEVSFGREKEDGLCGVSKGISKNVVWGM